MLKQVAEELNTARQSVLLAENKVASQPAVSITEIKINWMGALFISTGDVHFFSLAIGPNFPVYNVRR